jgi:surface antigen
MKPIPALLLLFIGLLVTSSTTAQNLNFLDRSAASELTPGDETILRAAFQKALEDTPDKETVNWENPETGHFGSISLLDTHQDFNTTCRTIRTLTTAGGREGGGRYRLCLADDDSWRFAPLRRPPGP